MVGYEMKRRRFTELHRAALRWPPDRFRYIGIDPGKETPTAEEGEVCLRLILPRVSLITHTLA